MNKLRVFQTVKIKRIVPGFSIKNIGTVLLFLLFLPYLLTYLFGNVKGDTEVLSDSVSKNLTGGRTFVCNTTSMGSEKIPLEVYVADKLARSIDPNYELETLKAQAVLLRSSLLMEEVTRDINGDIVVKDEGYGSGILSNQMLEAVAQTAGVYLAYNNKPINGAYYKVSNGATRNGIEGGLVECSYLKSVMCSRDFLSKEYNEIIKVNKDVFDRTWSEMTKCKVSEEEILSNEKIMVEKEAMDTSLYRDSTGYVLYVEREEEFVLGEQFRLGFYIPSASFHLIEDESEIEITVRGVGHGYGMSQFGANEMAKEGDDYVKILNYFFTDVTISKFE